MNKEIYIKLTKLQNGLNLFVIGEDWKDKISIEQWSLAINQEIAELADSYPWKWWKDTSKEADLNNIKIELTDILHFALSGKFLLQDNLLNIEAKKAFLYIKENNISDSEVPVTSILGLNHLSLNYNFTELIDCTIKLANDLDFNLPAYYIAKHTLNYIRQLKGYKSGLYKKKEDDGIEDNVLLHSSIKGISIDDINSDFDSNYLKISNKIYKAFNVDSTGVKSLQNWIKE